MLAELALYYLPGDHWFLPFVVAPVARHQDSLILAPSNIAKHQDQFVSSLYKTIPNATLKTVYVRVFSYDSYTVVSAVFPSTVTEPETMRTGAALGLGVLLNRQAFAELLEPSSSYFSALVRLMNRIFHIDLFQDGADVVIRAINDEACHKDLRVKFEQLLDLATEWTLPVHPRRRSRWLSLSLRPPSLARLPKAVIFNPIDGLSMLRSFLSEIDLYMSHRPLAGLEISSHQFANERCLAMIPIDYPLRDAKSASLSKTSAGRQIRID